VREKERVGLEEMKDREETTNKGVEFPTSALTLVDAHFALSACPL